MNLQFSLRTRNRRGRPLWRLATAGLLFAISTAVFAQDEPPLPVDPRPLEQLITDAERVAISQARDPKKLVETYLKISENRLQAALQATKSGDINRAERELDTYNKAVAEAAEVAFAQKNGKRGLSKKLEQTLYRCLQALGSIEKLFPTPKLPFAEAATKHTKQVRVQALNVALGEGEIIKQPDSDPTKKPDGVPQGLRAPLKQTSRFMPVAFVSIRAAYQIPGDYLTEEEDEYVRQAQKIEDRVKVFMKIADRRLARLKPQPVAGTDKKAMERAEKERREWGELPQMDRAQLLRHYGRAIDEALVKLDDAYERNPKNSALPKAVNTLLASTEAHLQQLRSLEPDMQGDAEAFALKSAISKAEQAIQDARGALKALTAKP